MVRRRVHRELARQDSRGGKTLRGKLPRRPAGKAISRVRILRSTLLVWQRKQVVESVVCQGRRVEGNARGCVKISHAMAAQSYIHLEPNSKHEISHSAVYGYFHKHLCEIPLKPSSMSQQYVSSSTCFSGAGTSRTSVSQLLAAASCQARYNRDACRYCMRRLQAAYTQPEDTTLHAQILSLALYALGSFRLVS
jgi:hypothetical protein